MFTAVRSLFTLFTVVVLLLFSLSSHAEPELTITYGADYKPFAWDEYGIAFGIQKDFVEEVLGKRMGIKVRHESCPWKRCQQLVRQGEKDGFFTVPTAERSEYTIASSIPFYETHFVMHTAKDNPHLAQLKRVRRLTDLENMPDITHVHMLGSGWHEDALKNMKNVQKNVDAAKIPLILAYRRADLYIEQAEMFRYQAAQQGVLDQLVTLREPSIRKLGWHLFIAEDSPHARLMPEINATLESLRDSGELEQIKHSLFAKYGIE